MRLGVVGTGYVGLVSGTCFADIGHEVTCVDIDEQKVERMQNGEIPIYEPQLEDLFQKNIEANRLRFTTDLSQAILDTEVVFLALPTPESDDGSADLSYVLQAAEDIGPLLTNYTVIVNKSTVPVGTVPKVDERIARGARVEYDVISNPEFLREGYAVDDFKRPARIVIGTDNERTRPIMEEVYERLVRNDHPIDFVLPASAEMGKYASNAFLATKISFANFLAQMCEQYGADIQEVAKIMGDDPRIGRDFLNAGIGWGGSCFPKDVQALIMMAREVGVNPGIVEEATVTNGEMRRLMPAKIKNFYETQDLSGRRFALLGLAFKENTDDVREAPAFDIVRDLTDAGAEIVAYDPQAKETFQRKIERELPNIRGLRLVDSIEEAVTGSDALITATLWPEFSTMDLRRVRDLLKEPVIFDGRHVWKRPERVRAAGFKYVTIGKTSDKKAA